MAESFLEAVRVFFRLLSVPYVAQKMSEFVQQNPNWNNNLNEVPNILEIYVEGIIEAIKRRMINREALEQLRKEYAKLSEKFDSLKKRCVKEGERPKIFVKEDERPKKIFVKEEKEDERPKKIFVKEEKEEECKRVLRKRLVKVEKEEECKRVLRKRFVKEEKEEECKRVLRKRRKA
ncbi:hypothetical protein NPIL_127341 [Nephila pilipes]|uniref:Uncharacterized protein n=1 Tax=Nephila pilipes TaxID=299642 RepID=A0A8X6TE38_NEPPI|nr:hypothetical protein NPIL_127341 [Nephila pilipes]